MKSFLKTVGSIIMALVIMIAASAGVKQARIWIAGATNPPAKTLDDIKEKMAKTKPITFEQQQKEFAKIRLDKALKSEEVFDKLRDEEMTALASVKNDMVLPMEVAPGIFFTGIGYNNKANTIYYNYKFTEFSLEEVKESFNQSIQDVMKKDLLNSMKANHEKTKFFYRIIREYGCQVYYQYFSKDDQYCFKVILRPEDITI